MILGLSSPLFQISLLLSFYHFFTLCLFSPSSFSSLSSFSRGVIYEDTFQQRWDLRNIANNNNFILSHLHYSISLDGDLFCTTNSSFPVPVCGTDFQFSKYLVPSWHSLNGLFTIYFIFF